MSKMERRDDGSGGARTCEYSGLERGEQNKEVGTDSLLGELNALVCIFTGGFTIIISRHLEY